MCVQSSLGNNVPTWSGRSVSIRLCARTAPIRNRHVGCSVDIKEIGSRRVAAHMLAINDLSVRHGHGQPWRLQGFDLRIGPGECCAVVGPAGAGKTAVLEAVMGLCPVDGGTIRVGSSASDADAIERRRNITAIWGAGAVDDALTVRQNVELILRLAGTPLPTPSVINRALRVMEMPDRRITQPTSALTSMQRFSMWLAIAQLRGTPILLLDDPTATWTMTDIRTATQLHNELRRSGLTILLSTRDTDFGCALADRIVLLDSGRKVAEGAPSVIFSATAMDRP